MTPEQAKAVIFLGPTEEEKIDALTTISGMNHTYGYQCESLWNCSPEEWVEIEELSIEKGWTREEAEQEIERSKRVYSTLQPITRRNYRLIRRLIGPPETLEDEE